MLPLLKVSFPNVIWKIEIDGLKKTLAIETRNASAHEAYFSAFNYQQGSTLFYQLSIENSWWWGLDLAAEEMFFLHGYKSKTSPERKGIIALDKNGNEAWSKFNAAIELLSPEGLVIYNPSVQPKQFELVCLHKGQRIEFSSKYYPIDNQIKHPKVENKLPAYILDTAVGPIYWGTVNDKFCWCYHTTYKGLLNQKLVICQSEKIILNDVIASGIQKLNPETFFMQQNHIFYIRNKIEIVVYSL